MLERDCVGVKRPQRCKARDRIGTQHLYSFCCIRENEVISNVSLVNKCVYVCLLVHLHDLLVCIFLQNDKNWIPVETNCSHMNRPTCSHKHTLSLKQSLSLCISKSDQTRSQGNDGFIHPSPFAHGHTLTLTQSASSQNENTNYSHAQKRKEQMVYSLSNFLPVSSAWGEDVLKESEVRENPKFLPWSLNNLETPLHWSLERRNRGKHGGRGSTRRLWRYGKQEKWV